MEINNNNNKKPLVDTNKSWVSTICGGTRGEQKGSYAERYLKRTDYHNSEFVINGGGTAEENNDINISSSVISDNYDDNKRSDSNNYDDDYNRERGGNGEEVLIAALHEDSREALLEIAAETIYQYIEDLKALIIRSDKSNAPEPVENYVKEEREKLRREEETRMEQMLCEKEEAQQMLDGVAATKRAMEDAKRIAEAVKFTQEKNTCVNKVDISNKNKTIHTVLSVMTDNDTDKEKKIIDIKKNILSCDTKYPENLLSYITEADYQKQAKLSLQKSLTNDVKVQHHHYQSNSRSL